MPCSKSIVMARSTGSSSEGPDPRGGGGLTRAYLDYANFSPVDPRVVAVMRPYLEGGAGNPSAAHSLGIEARTSLDGARAKIARLVGGTAGGVIFTASATEANNLAVKGFAARAAGRHLVTSSIEHISVLNSCKDLEKRGWAVTYVPVDGDGRVDPDSVARALRADTALVSVQAANGEIGTLQPIADIGRLARRRGVAFHVDGVGAAGRIPLAVDECGIDLLSLSANDLHGPPGAGALWVRPDIKLAPLIVGGAQEGGYRAGTENLPAVVGMGVAAELARVERAAEATRLGTLRDRLIDGVTQAVSGARLTGSPGGMRLPHHASFVIPGVKADAVLLELDLRGIAAASGSACGALTGEPSHVLRAIGCDRATAESSLCFTGGRWTTAAEVAAVIEALPAVVDRLRRLAP
jgi:cysteine desulfurase